MKINTNKDKIILELTEDEALSLLQMLDELWSHSKRIVCFSPILSLGMQMIDKLNTALTEEEE